jgi:hypothetical protein
MAVTGMSRPDYRTVAEFRRRHLPALGDLFVQVLRLCREAGLVKLGHVALDGTKIKANASKHKAMSYGRMGAAEARLEAEVTAWLARAAAADAEEDCTHGPERGDEMPDWIADKQQRLERLRAAKAALEAEAQVLPADDDGPGPSTGMMDHGKPKRSPDGGPPDRAQRNFTDPDSRTADPRRHGPGLQRPDRRRRRASDHPGAARADQRRGPRRGEASHSPQPTWPPAATRTSSASWLPSPSVVTSGIER